jgi:plastocyanin
MKTNTKVFTLVLLASSVQFLSAAEISGKVKLNGTPPPEATLKMTDAVCGKQRGNEMISSRHYVVGADKGLANVFVWVKNGAAPKPPAGEGPTLDQTSCEYQPYVFGVQVGQTYKIKNSDPTLHNIHSTPKFNKPFNKAQTQGVVFDQTFDKPEVFVRFQCDVHPWMFAFCAVVDHPYFAVTDKDGNFKISGLPAGKYTIEALHPKIGQKGAKTMEVTVSDSDKKTADFTLDVPAPN